MELEPVGPTLFLRKSVGWLFFSEEMTQKVVRKKLILLEFL